MQKHRKQANGGRSKAMAVELARPNGNERRPIAKTQRLRDWIKAHKVLSAIFAIAVFTMTASALRYLDQDAQRQRLLVGSPHVSKGRASWLDAVNPFLPDPTPTPTPQLSKEYLYAGSRLLAVEDANANAAPPADLAVWRPSDGTWYVLGGVPGSQQTSYAWGMNGDKPVPGDFDGDGKTDFAIWRPDETTATWYIVPSSTGSYYTVNQGLTGDIPTVADFDGDGKSDLVLYRPSNNTFYVIKSSGGTAGIQLGASGDMPVPHDYDGDGLADFAVFRPSNHTFYTINSSNPTTGQTVAVGANNDTPVPCDYDGDGKADFATFINGYWTIKSSSTGSTSNYYYGTTGDQPVENDYDGDGLCDRAIWRPAANAVWWIRKTTTDTDRTEYWGTTADIPVPAYYRR